MCFTYGIHNAVVGCNHVQLQPLGVCCTSISTQATHLSVHTLKTMVAGEEHWCDRLNLLWQGTRTWNCRGSLLYSSDTPCMYSSSSVVKTLRFTLNVLERKYKGFSLCAMSVLCPPTVYPMLNCEHACMGKPCGLHPVASCNECRNFSYNSRVLVFKRKEILFLTD